MKAITSDLEKCRIRGGPFASRPEDGNNGCFIIRSPQLRSLVVIISDGLDWDHVSVSVDHKPNLTPTWREMCFIKHLFFEAGEWVVQYHPSQESYINFHEGALHLWRPQNQEIPKPPLEMV